MFVVINAVTSPAPCLSEPRLPVDEWLPPDSCHSRPTLGHLDITHRFGMTKNGGRNDLFKPWLKLLRLSTFLYSPVKVSCTFRQNCFNVDASVSDHSVDSPLRNNTLLSLVYTMKRQNLYWEGNGKCGRTLLFIY